MRQILCSDWLPTTQMAASQQAVFPAAATHFNNKIALFYTAEE